MVAGLHALPLEEFLGLSEFAERSPENRREFAAEMLTEFESLESAPHDEARRALQVLRDHLPAAKPLCLLHGDFRAENIRLKLRGATALIDWERAHLGDPAWDLAVITNGGSKPFQTKGGRKKLLSAYREAGGEAISEGAVQYYELVRALRDYARAYRGESCAHPIETYADSIRSQLNRFRA